MKAGYEISQKARNEINKYNKLKTVVTVKEKALVYLCIIKSFESVVAHICFWLFYAFVTCQERLMT